MPCITCNQKEDVFHSQLIIGSMKMAVKCTTAYSTKLFDAVGDRSTEACAALGMHKVFGIYSLQTYV